MGFIRALPAYLVIVACAASEPPPTVTIASPASSGSSSLPATIGGGAGSTPALSPSSIDASASNRRGVSNGPHCPSTFVLDGGTCHIGDGECVYPEGRCLCGDFPHCGGAAVRPPLEGASGRIYCTPNDPKMPRRDGCTFLQPPASSSCNPEGKVCLYGPCEWSRATYTCKHGAWSVRQYHGPPPP